MAASRAGAKVHFVAKVGKDQFSQFAYDHLSSSEILSFKLYQSDSEPTGNAIIYVSQQDGENMIAIYPGANKTITDDEVAAIMPELADSNVLLLQLENNFAATLNAMKLAKTLNSKVVLNPAPYSHDALNCLEYVDVITPMKPKPRCFPVSKCAIWPARNRPRRRLSPSARRGSS